ncbi:MAG: hypothetical protein Q4C75_02820 [Bergeyella zoohelcum]|nr:hypothetical protein [Bergeyella zoohelcum]
MKIVNFVLLMLVGFLFNSCSREEVMEIPEITNKETILKLQESGVRGIPFPEGSQAIRVASEVDIMKIVLPKEVYFVVKNEEGKVFKISEIGVRCRCSLGSGCSPISAMGQYFCLMNDGCKVCSSKPVTEVTPNSGKFDENVTIVGVMDERRGLAVFSDKKGLFSTNESAKQYGITEDFFECKEVKSALEDFYNAVYGNNIPDFIKNNTGKLPKGHVYIKIDLFGNNILLPTPKYDKDGYEMFSDVEEIDGDIGEIEGTLCRCYKGKGCTLGSKFGAKYCDAGKCSDCALKN